MTTRHTRIAIIGAGLSGLYAAQRLINQGVSDFVLLEARDRIDGRIELHGKADVEGEGGYTVT